jgi:hypothetical protein
MNAGGQVWGRVVDIVVVGRGRWTKDVGAEEACDVTKALGVWRIWRIGRD